MSTLTPMSSDDMVGTLVSGFRIVVPVGQGDMGTVYLAEQAALGRRVAIKVLGGAVSGDPRAIERYLAEAKVVNDLRHPNIVEILDFGELTNRMEVSPSGRTRTVHYLMMEWLEGETVGKRLDAGHIFTVADAISILNQAALALAAAHERGVIHRNLKPEEIFLANYYNRGSHVKLLDFGAVRLTRTGRTSGIARRMTPSARRLAYMAPELFGRDSEVAPATDVYALGVIAYEMLTGRCPFLRDDAIKTLRAHVHSTPPPPHRLGRQIPVALSGVIMRALAKRPSDRYEDMAALRQALQAAATPTEPCEALPRIAPSADESRKIEHRQAKAVADRLRQIVHRRLSEDRLQLPSMPLVAVRALDKLSDPEATPAAMSRVIEKDPIIASRVLRIALGAGLSKGRKHTLVEAVKAVGLKQLRVMLVQMSAFQVCLPRNAAIRRSFRGIWQHCLAVGALARAFSTRTKSGVDGDAAYLAGLLHDIGKPIVACLLVEAERMMHRETRQPWLTDTLWLRVLAECHRDIAVQVIDRWSLPPQIARGIAGSIGYDDAAGKHSCANLVRYANALAKREGMDVGPIDAESVVTTIMRGRRLLGVSELLEEEVISSVRSDVTPMTRSSVPSRDTMLRMRETLNELFDAAAVSEDPPVEPEDDASPAPARRRTHRDKRSTLMGAAGAQAIRETAANIDRETARDTLLDDDAVRALTDSMLEATKLQ